MPQWVQHMSGIGEKWEVADGPDYVSVWLVQPKGEGCWYPYLPKSEYVLCDPPDEWEDVTADYKIYFSVKSMTVRDGERIVYQDGLHNGPHFVIQRMKS